MRFTKMNGAGNDFIIIDNRDKYICASVYGELAKILCERRLSIGADGMIIIEKSDDRQTDFKIRFINCDGSLAEMCGNGVRCICRYAADNGLSGDCQRVKTDSGIVTGKKIDKDNYRIHLNSATKIEINKRLFLKGAVYEYAYIELGTPGLPHAVLRMPGLADMPDDSLLRLGLAIIHCPDFEKGVNVNFYDIPDTSRRSDIIIRTCERFVDDLTYACGTGAGSTALALRLMGCDSDTYRFYSKGGILKVELVSSDDFGKYDIYLSGPVCTVAEGEILDTRALRLMLK